MQRSRLTRLSTYSDSYLVRDTTTTKSKFGWAVQMIGGMVAWRSFKQRFEAVSSTETEYVSLRECIQNV